MAGSGLPHPEKYFPQRRLKTESNSRSTGTDWPHKKCQRPESEEFLLQTLKCPYPVPVVMKMMQTVTLEIQVVTEKSRITRQLGHLRLESSRFQDRRCLKDCWEMRQREFEERQGYVEKLMSFNHKLG